jgi:hexokinase
LQVKEIVDIVVSRAANLVAAGMTALLVKANAQTHESTSSIAADGSVFKRYVKFRERLYASLARSLEPYRGAVEVDTGALVGWKDPEKGPKFRVKFVQAPGGSCFGAAVIGASQALAERE